MAAAQTFVRRSESTVGPVAFGGRTITLAARTTAIHLGDRWGALHVRTRPVHVEVLDDGGHRQVIPVRDVEHTLVGAIALAGIVGAYAVRVFRNRRSVE